MLARDSLQETDLLDARHKQAAIYPVTNDEQALLQRGSEKARFPDDMLLFNDDLKKPYDRSSGTTADLQHNCDLNLSDTKNSAWLCFAADNRFC
jgi:hypothetical protein